MNGKLTIRQRRFVAEYVKDGNGQKAAIEAGYAPSSAKVTASRLLTSANVLAALKKPVDKLDLSIERIAEEIARVGFANMLDYMRVENGEFSLDFSKLTREQAAAIQEVTVDQYAGGAGDGERRQVVRTRFKLGSKVQALELLGRFKKMFVDRLEVTGLEGLAERLQQARKQAGKV